MGKLNYFFNAPYSNPAGEIDKQTNEIPSKIKAKTSSRKRGTMKSVKKKEEPAQD